jgi:anti-sigma factor RsiW
MTRDEARLLLEAARPAGRDANDPALAEALALARSDAELQAWWEARQKFDRAIAARLGEIAPPASLREAILAESKVVPFSPRSYVMPWLAVAAAFVIAAISYHLILGAPGPLPRADYMASVVTALNDDKPALAMQSPDHQQVLAWLKGQHAPTGQFPSALDALPSVGCQKFDMGGHTVTLICFALNGGGLAHLFIVDKSALAEPPADFSPSFGSHDGGWSMAAWSDGRMSYVLATRAGPETLKGLL